MDFHVDFCRRLQPDVPRPRGLVRAENSHFQVDEILGFDPSGEGEHLYLQIRKNGQNTVWVKQQLARQLGVEPLDIGHSGLKDRHAVTTQWLSIYAPSAEYDPVEIDIEGVEVLQSCRHTHKLRPGTHRANRFRILVTEIVQPQGLDNLLEQIAVQGFPNYFGEQRFGHDGNNLKHGWELLQKRKLKHHKNKSIYLSALRSFLFNKALSARIALDPERTSSFDFTGPLWGRGRSVVNGPQNEFEQSVLEPWRSLCEALEFSGLNQERRQVFQSAGDLVWSWPQNDQLLLDFSLPPGSFATALLYELLNWSETDVRG
ncbi:MAG: tRNA pseudouridine(13) synthase TruD [Porticoccaceae bacterium]